MFEGVWGKLEAKKYFQRQSFTKYLRITLVFMWNGALPEGFGYYYLLVLAEFSFWLGYWALGYHSMGFRHFPDVS